jgi:hypothetical protein
VAALAPAYRPRRPTETVLYALVREHLETFLEHARESYAAPLPRYVEEEFRGYLRCGVFAHGFVRAHCAQCGHDLLVGFSCKTRGICPSCAGRRMSSTAAHLVDRVLPAVPVRQWVLSLPFELRGIAAFRADALSAFGRAFVESVFTRYRARARAAGQEGRMHCGAITFVQRFGSSLNLNVHFHVVVLDGVVLCDDPERLRFQTVAPPARVELEGVAERVRARITAWLARRRRGRSLKQDDDQTHDAGPTSLDACAEIAMRRGEVRALRDDAGEESTESVIEPPRHPGTAVERAGFNVEASVGMEADDDLGRERLCRYGARPPFSLERLRRLAGGRVAYRVKKLRNGRAKQRIMTPLEFLARLAALVPPPRYPLVRYHGVLAPRSPWRSRVVPKPRAPDRCARLVTQTRASPDPEKLRSDSGHGSPATARATRPQASIPPLPTAPSALHRPGRAPADTLTTSTPAHFALAPLHRTAEPLTPNVLAVRHWARLLDGHLYAHSPRIDWARLLRRTFEVDVLQCPSCSGRLRVVDEISDPDIVRFVLERLGVPTQAPIPARARDPTELLGHGDLG